MPYIHDGPDLYLAADGQTVVEEGDPRAAFVLVVDGGQLSDEDAERYGLTKKKPAPAEEKGKEEPPPNKAKTSPPNKSKG